MLREARRSDLGAIQAIRLAVKENRLVSAVISDQQVVEALEKTGRGWVAEEHGRVVGFGIANRENRSIWALFVDPDFEGRGHGRRILEAMTGWLWSLGPEPIWLSTDPGTRAERFYAAAGWKTAGVLSNGEMRLELTTPSTNVKRS